MSRQPHSTRVFKKSSPNGKLTTYLGKRDFLDHVDYTDSIDGICLIDPEYMNAVPGRKVIGTLSCVFRYGREDLDVLGLTFRRDLYSLTQQIWPIPNEKENGENNTVLNPDHHHGADSTQSTVVAMANTNNRTNKTLESLTISPSQQPKELTTGKDRENWGNFRDVFGNFAFIFVSKLTLFHSANKTETKIGRKFLPVIFQNPKRLPMFSHPATSSW